MESLQLSGISRTELGKKNSNHTRKDEKVPCVLYGGEKNINFDAPYKSFKKIIFTDEFIKVDLDIDGSHHQAIVQEVQFHPLSDKIMHVDFLELLPGKKVVVDIPVRVSGFAKGVQAGGKLEVKMKKLRIKTTFENMIDQVHLDITDMEMGKTIKVKDLNLPGIDIVTPATSPVVQITIPRAARAAAEATPAKK